ncbi:MAG: dihydrolipoyl dehydrogenase [Candidatus Omnitrophota bacterium]|jgi:dihydrolipoamide dehydrogenase
MYDLAIIGAGWAGFNAAQRAKELKLKTCLIEKSYLGGTCLNSGCIPTKSLIQSVKIYSLAKKSLVFGVDLQNPVFNFLKMQERKDKIIQQLRSGMQFMLQGVDFLSAEAQITGNNEIRIGEKTINSKYILIACGSKPYELLPFKFDGKKIISSNEALKLTEAPKSILIIGGGVIGCEFASLFASLGTLVTIAEKMPQLLLGVDKEAAKKIETVFKKKKIRVNTNTDASTFNSGDFALVLICVGRVPNTDGLGLEKLGINLEKGRVIVDDYLRTNIANIYAAGDCTSKIMLAHYAAYQGLIAAGNIAHPVNLKKANNTIIPGCIFTDPEIASVGLSEDEARARNIEIKIQRSDFLSSGMARIIDETDGFIKIISEAKTDVIIGASIVGAKATELIAILTLAISKRLKTSELKDTIFAHPTLSESIHQALH